MAFIQLNNDLLVTIAITTLVVLVIVLIIMYVAYSYARAKVEESSQYRMIKRLGKLTSKAENLTDEQIDSLTHLISSFAAPPSQVEETNDDMF